MTSMLSRLSMRISMVSILALSMTACSSTTQERLSMSIINGINGGHTIIDYGARVPNMEGDWQRFCEGDSRGRC